MREIDPDVHDALIDFIKNADHEFVRGLYNLNRFLRNKLQCDKLPVHTLYTLSLFEDLNGDALTVEELAKREGLNKRTAYNIQRKYYEYRKKIKSLAGSSPHLKTKQYFTKRSNLL